MNGARSIVFLTVAAVILPFATLAQQVPPGARPGASQPRDITSPIPTLREPLEFRIPPVIERPLGVDEGARVFVHSFEVQGILQDPNAPALGAEVRARVAAELEAARALVEQQRIERQRIGDVGPDGFTEEERQRIVDFLNFALRELDQNERIAAYQRFVQELELQRLEREQGLTIGQIQQVADAVTEVYHGYGYLLARAIVPAQEVNDGIVVIRVLEGRLGDVKIENNQMFDTETLERPFAGMEGQLITISQIEDALLTLTDYPGLQAFGTFRPGEAVGTADIVINVTGEDRFELGATIDNHGTRFTGQDRLAGTLDINSTFVSGDRTSMSVMRAFNPTNTTLGTFVYTRPFEDPATVMTLEAARNGFDITSPGLGTARFGGISRTAMIKIEHAFQRGRQYSMYGSVDFTRKRGETLQGVRTFNQDDLAVIGFQTRYDLIDSEANALESAFLRVDFGVDDQFGIPSNAAVRTPAPGDPRPSRVDAVPRFTKVTAGFSRLKSLGPKHSFMVRFAGQWSNDLLTSLEQFSVGGPQQLRAAPVSVFLGDKGVFGSAEWLLRAPGFTDEPGPGGRTWGDVMTMSIFYDHAIAWTNEPLRPEEERFSLKGWGVGVDFSLPGSWGMKVQWARLIGGRREGTGPNDPTRINDKYQAWVDFRLSL